MMMNYVRYVVAVFLIFMFPLSSSAETYQHLLMPESQISFAYHQFHIPLKGDFKRFGGDILFNSEHPEQSFIRLYVDTSSIETGSARGNLQSQTSVWLDTADYHSAYFYSTHITSTGNGSYNVVGQFKIKGHTITISFPVSVIYQGKIVVLEGYFNFDRNVFDLGSRSEALNHMLSPKIQMVFRIIAD